MRRNVLLSIAATCILATSTQAQHRLVKLWESTEQLPVPESVLPMLQSKELFVSLIDGGSSDKDGKGGIATLHLDGTLKDPTWVEGLNAPKGLAVHKGLLYVSDITEVVVIEISSGKIREKIPVSGSTFLNDVTIDKDGRVFVSDSRQNKVFKIEKGKASVYLDEVTNANGLKMVQDNLYVLAAKELWKVNPKKEKTRVAEGFAEVADGIEPVGNGDFLVTCWAGLIYYVKATGEIQQLLDVRGKMNTADLGYHQDEKILYIPTFNSNSVVAYRLD